MTSTTFIDRDGLAVKRAGDAVFMLRVTKRGFLSWHWELWEVAQTWTRVVHYRKAEAVLRPTILFHASHCPTRLQAVHQATLYAIRHIPSNHSVV